MYLYFLQQLYFDDLILANHYDYYDQTIFTHAKALIYSWAQNLPCHITYENRINLLLEPPQKCCCTNGLNNRAKLIKKSHKNVDQ